MVEDVGKRRGGGGVDAKKRAYFAELIRVDDETAAFFRDVLHCCGPGGQVVGVWSDVDSSNLIGGDSSGR